MFPECLTPNEPRFFGKNDSETIQAAIAAACADGSRTVRVPRYNARRDADEWRIPVSIKLPDDFTLYLDNCYMVQETGCFDVMFVNSLFEDREKIRKAENEQHNISLIGLGNVCLSGGEHNRLMERTSNKYGCPDENFHNNLIAFFNVDHLRVENIHMEHQRWWAMVHMFCRNAVLKNLDFYVYPHVVNLDDIDLRQGCNNFVIENITGRSGDDVLALTAVGCKFENSHLVEGKDFDIHDIRIRNVQADPHHFFCVRLLNHDGRKLYNIDADTIMDTSDYTTKQTPNACINIGSPTYPSISLSQPGDTHHITFRNLYSRGSAAMELNHMIHDTLISNVHAYGDCSQVMRGWKPEPKLTAFKNVTIEHIFFDRWQRLGWNWKELPVEDFTGEFMSFSLASGDLTLRDVNVRNIRTVFRARGDLSVRVDGFALNKCLNYVDMDPACSLVIDGKEQNHG